MSLHRLTSITLGVPDVDAVEQYYLDFGLSKAEDGTFSTSDGGQQLRLEYSPQRKLLHLGIGAENPDDVGRIAKNLEKIEAPFATNVDGTVLTTREPVAGYSVEVSIAPTYVQTPAVQEAYNLPGRPGRLNNRAPGILREGPVRPRKLGHLALGTTDLEATERFFVDGFGFKVTDTVHGHGSFIRCSEEHHNLFVQRAPANFLHHSAWQVEDIDEIGRGAMALLEGKPERHAWGPGRHFLGSNFFWYFRDPAGNFSEYYSDIDTILDDGLWTAEDWDGAKGMFAWGPQPTPSFLMPEDVAAHMIGAHSTKG